jgi:3-dehydroquinate dehydratase II
MNKILVLHGPNLNLLGTRETDIYGQTTLPEIDAELKHVAKQHKAELIARQSNSESELISIIHEAKQQYINYIIINPAAFTHTSIAIRDALIAINIPFIEVHISNVFSRESFRHHSYLSDIATGVISGLGSYGYTLALLAIFNTLNKA